MVSAIIGHAIVRACGFAKNAQLSATCGELRGYLIGFNLNLNRGIKGNLEKRSRERDENEEQNQWLYDSQRRVGCVSVGSLYRLVGVSVA